MSQSGGSATPGAASVLDGFVSAAAAGTTTLITVPAGRTWIGSVGANVSAQNPLGTATGDASVAITTAGAGATPAAGSVARCDAELPATAAGSVMGVADTAMIPPQRLVVVAPAGNAVTVQAVVATAGVVTALVANAWAIGELQ